MDILYQIQFLRHQFSRQEAKVAQTILDNVSFASSATIEQLAAHAGVSTETVGHFAKSLGCRDINDFIAHMRRQVVDEKPAPASVASPILGGMDVAFASLSSMRNLPGMTPERLSRFAKSVGFEDIGDIIYQIRAQLTQLSQQEAKVAQAILDDVSFASSATIEQLAAQAGVSPATITRFAKSVGCDDIRDLRMKLAQASAVGSRYLQVPTAANTSRWQQKIDQLHHYLQAQLQQFNEQQFVDAGEAINQASGGLFVFSQGVSASLLAQQLQHTLVRSSYAAVAYQEPELMSITVSTLSSAHVLLLLSAKGENAVLLNVANQARARGVTVVALTPAASSLAQHADITLSLQPTDTPMLVADGRYGMMLAVDLLLAQIAQSAGEPRKTLLAGALQSLEE